MQLSRYSDYSLRVLMYLAVRPEHLATIGEIAAAYGISNAHLMKVAHELGRSGLLETVRGRGGGIRLARAPGEIGVGDVIRQTEGPLALVECFEAGARHCRIEASCGLRPVLDEALAAFLETLDRYTLADLVARRRQPLSRLLYVARSCAASGGARTAAEGAAVTIGAANSIAALLSADHRAVDALLAEVKRRLAAGAIGPAARLFAEFRAGLERHIAAEEEILFPALESRLAAHGPGPVRVMRAEHAELTRLMAEVAALESTSLESHATPLPALTARIYAHNGKEERMLYPMADLAINDAPERAGLLRRLAAATTHTRGLRGAGALPPAID